jgi:hypothetical protein
LRIWISRRLERTGFRPLSLASPSETSWSAWSGRTAPPGAVLDQPPLQPRLLGSGREWLQHQPRQRENPATYRGDSHTGRHNLASRIPSVWLLRTSGPPGPPPRPRGSPQRNPWYPRQTVRTSAMTGSLRARLCQTSGRASSLPTREGAQSWSGGEVLRPTGEAARGRGRRLLLGTGRLEPGPNSRNYNM